MQVQIGYGTLADQISKTKRIVVKMISRGVIGCGSFCLCFL